MSDFKKLMVEELKASGLDIAEDAVELIVKTIFKVSKVAIKASPTMWDDVLLPALPFVETALLKLVDKIDGEVEPIREEEKI